MKYSLILGLAAFYMQEANTLAVMCNPLKTKYCEPNPALGTTLFETFEQESLHFVNYTNSGIVEYSSEGVSFTIGKRLDNPALMSDFYIMYGKVEVQLKAAEGNGIVSSFYLQSDAQDEIDFEWLGGDTNHFQSNFFSKGDTTTYARGQFHPVHEPQKTFHVYTLDWRMDGTKWYVDGIEVRTLNNDSVDGYPQTPMRLYMGIWAGGDPSNQPGTIQWAGGETDYEKIPFTAYVRKVIVSDYSSGEKYIYSDQTGTWSSIVAVGGNINDRYNQANLEFKETKKTDPSQPMIYYAEADIDTAMTDWKKNKKDEKEKDRDKNKRKNFPTKGRVFKSFSVPQLPSVEKSKINSNNVCALRSPDTQIQGDSCIGAEMPTIKKNIPQSNGLSRNNLNKGTVAYDVLFENSYDVDLTSVPSAFGERKHSTNLEIFKSNLPTNTLNHPTLSLSSTTVLSSIPNNQIYESQISLLMTNYKSSTERKDHTTEILTSNNGCKRSFKISYTLIALLNFLSIL